MMLTSNRCGEWGVSSCSKSKSDHVVASPRKLSPIKNETHESNQEVKARLLDIHISIRKMDSFPATLTEVNRFAYGSSQKLCHFSETTYQPILLAVTEPGDP